MDPATTRFRLALPYVLFPASPPLAALHAERARTLHSEHVPPDYPACSRCGSLLVQNRRSFNNKEHKRILRRSCRICGAVKDFSLPTATFPPTRAHGTITPKPSPIPEVLPPSPPKDIPPVPSTVPVKSRPKKKSGLQHLLARNRENEEKERQKQKQPSSHLGGLAAFLSDLS
ncbi:hypothetical protein AN958_05515 [Leucoagaricus sp. SymC.cos]|nr:hypothetical protein AN958_05515 [Leucoagaricus sp. SymC.cos]